MTRIANLAANEHLLGILTRTQNQVQDLQTQVATGKRSQTYAGIAKNTRELLGLERSRQVLERFDRNNDMMKIRLDTTTTAVDGITETVRQLRNQLLALNSGTDARDPEWISGLNKLQNAAFSAMQSMAADLNTKVDGQYLFAGSQVRTQPVKLPAATLEQFQQIYDGDAVIYPPTADAQLGSRGVLTHLDTGDLQMSDSNADNIGDTITATKQGVFASLEPGMTITIAGGNSGNNKTFTVASIDATGTSIAINGQLKDAAGNTVGTPPLTTTNSVVLDTSLTPPSTDTTASITIGNWYQGDMLGHMHRLDEDRSLSLGLNATDAAFEKAMRAFGILAQGGLVVPDPANPGHEMADTKEAKRRITGALVLLNSVLDRAAPLDGVYGREKGGGLDDVSSALGFQQVALEEAQSLHQHMAGIFEDRSAKLENADKTEAITLLLNGTQALEASYQVLARVQQLSLTKFL
jgi:flagellar hook-associated protein 3 FlgL